MSVITKGKTFANGEQLTAGKLNQMLDAAVFSSAAVDNTKTTLSGGAITIAPDAITSTEVAQSFLDTIYPIGSIYTNATDSTNPGTLLGFGTWDEFAEGKVAVGKASSGTFDTAGNTGGAETHTLTTSEIPSHSHSIDTRTNPEVEYFGGAETSVREFRDDSDPGGVDTTDNTNATGGGGAHNNLQPYIVVYMWKRTA